MHEYEVCFNNSKVSTMIEDISPEFAIIAAVRRKGLTEVASVIVYEDAAIVYQCGRCILQGGHLSIKDE